MKKIVKKGASWLVLLAMVLSLCGGFSVPLTAAVSVNEATIRPVKPITPEEVFIDWSKYFPEGWDDAFVGSTGTVKIDINEVISFGEKEEFVYNGEPQAPKLKVAEGLERGVDYEILYAQIVRDETTDLGLKTVDVEACVDAGYYMMVVFGMGAYGGSVLDGQWNQRVFCIEQADSDVVITLPASVSALCGQTMKDIPLDDFSADAEGTFSWPDPDFSVGNVGNNQRVVVFTPENMNYKSVRREVTVVVAPLSACPKDEVCPLSGFSDLDADQWYHDGVHYCLANGTMVGMSDGVFSPEGKSTRAQIVMMLWRLEGSPVVDHNMTFGDVADGAWYEDAVGWAQSEGIVMGISENEFAPDQIVTREQMVTMMYRYAEEKGYDVTVGEDTDILRYKDAESIGEWAMDAMMWAVGSGLINGYGDGTLAPQAPASRAELAAVMYRFCEAIEK